MSNCKDVYTPDFSDKEPCELKSSDCVIYQDAIAYLGLEENATITEVIKNLVDSLKDARDRIENLENS